MDKAVNSRFDLNGDGAVDLKDLAWAAKVAGVTVSAAAAAIGVTASTSVAATYGGIKGYCELKGAA